MRGTPQTFCCRCTSLTKKGIVHGMLAGSKRKVSVRSDEGCLSVFECPVCFETASPPIPQCSSGHIVCTFCLHKINDKNCPSCRKKMGTGRNLALEKIAEELMVSCRNVGCSMAVTLASRKTHEEQNCSARKFNCPCASCNWTGDLSEVAMHLQTVHKRSTKVLNSCISLKIPTKLVTSPIPNMHYETVLESSGRGKHGKYFLRMMSTGTILRIALTSISDRIGSRRAKLKIVGGHGADRRSFSFSCFPNSIRQSFQSICEDDDCLIVSQKILNRFSGAELHISFKP